MLQRLCEKRSCDEVDVIIKYFNNLLKTKYGSIADKYDIRWDKLISYLCKNDEWFRECCEQFTIKNKNVK